MVDGSLMANPDVPIKVMVAEDSPTVRRLVCTRLVADGFEVIEAQDGAEALELAISERPAALVLDKVMPKLDGFEVVRLLRDREETRDVPIVMLTEHSNEDDVLGGLGLGVDEYMPKPFSPRELSMRLGRLLARSRPAS
jgi:DNA-binding response OmpR family regulator